MIPFSAWYFAPVLTFLWLYRGWSLGRALRVTIPLWLIIFAFQAGFLSGIFITALFVAAFMIYGDAKQEGFRFAWVWGVATFFFSIVVVPVYLLKIWIYERSLVKSGRIINDEQGQITFRK